MISKTTKKSISPVKKGVGCNRPPVTPRPPAPPKIEKPEKKQN